MATTSKKQATDLIQEKRAKSAPIEYKTMAFALKEPVINGRIVTGYLAVFGNKDCDGDILIKGCFAKSLNERGVGTTGTNKIAHLWQHDMREPLGSYKVLQEDDFGLYFECEYDDIEQANRALVQFKSGTLDKFSIGYCYVWDKMEYDYEKEAFICKELNLFEGSVVTLAANDQTYFAGLKSAQRESAVESLSEAIDEALRGIKGEKQYELRQLTAKLLTLARLEPIADLKAALKGKQAEPKKSRFSKLAELNKEG